MGEAGERPAFEQLVLYLAERELLLVLDGFERVVDAAGLVGGLLAACPAVKVLVSSQVVLRLSGEHEFIVLPLAVPELRAERGRRGDVSVGRVVRAAGAGGAAGFHAERRKRSGRRRDLCPA